MAPCSVEQNKNLHMKNLKIIIGIICFLNILSVYAQNPISVPGVYNANPEARVFSDGRIYIYGTRDESDKYWSSYAYHVLSSSDLRHWEIDENSFNSRGENDGIKDSDDLLFAPDCIERNGRYYLYYCMPDRSHTEGVAVADNPVGPFRNGKHIKGANQIDPAVFIDDDGKGYYYWGQASPKVARLSDDLLSIDTTTIAEPLDQKNKKVFHEGASVRKIGKQYYMIFADESRRGRPTCLGYAVSNSPMGPFIYKGVIIDNYGCDPSSWNNHGSIQCFNDQWYVFYHRSTNNSQKFRKTCVEPITIAEDGTIAEVEMTSQGAGTPFNGLQRMDASRACLMNGNVRIASLPTTDIPNEGLTQIKNNDWAAFKYIEFTSAAKSFSVKTVGLGEGIIDIILDKPDGKVIGTCKISSDKPNSYAIHNCVIKPVSGIHALYLRFKTTSNMPDVDWFIFNK